MASDQCDQPKDQDHRRQATTVAVSPFLDDGTIAVSSATRARVHRTSGAMAEPLSAMTDPADGPLTERLLRASGGSE